MNDEILEQHLRSLPAPELPEAWREEILATARHRAPMDRTDRPVWPPFFLWLRGVFARNPITAGALTALWFLIFFFRAGTPVDPSEKMLLTQVDPNSRVYFVSLQEEIRLVQAEPEPKPPAQFP